MKLLGLQGKATIQPDRIRFEDRFMQKKIVALSLCALLLSASAAFAQPRWGPRPYGPGPGVGVAIGAGIVGGVVGGLLAAPYYAPPPPVYVAPPPPYYYPPPPGYYYPPPPPRYYYPPPPPRW
jgi:hypothetical protein